jgi:hypothetical protein
MQEGFADEFEFWKGYIGEAEHSTWLEHLAKSDLPLDPKIQRLLGQHHLPSCATVRALDIGCGPLSVLGQHFFPQCTRSLAESGESNPQCPGSLPQRGHRAFSVFPCEAEHANYGGLHQWNFEVIDGAVVIWNAANRITLDELVAPHRYEVAVVPLQ